MYEKINDFQIHGKSEVKLTLMGNVIEKQYLSRRNKEATIQRLPDDKIMVLSSGEIKSIEHIENRLQDKKSLRMSLKRLRNYLNANITDVSYCRWVTLTYAENMTDTKRLYKDFDKFNKRMKYRYGDYEYIVAMEPQGRGAWHAHVVFIFPDKAPYIPHDELWSIWSPKGYKQKEIDNKGYDFVKIKKLDDVDNVGAYLTAYLGDMEVQEAIQNGVPIPTGDDIIKIVDYEDEKGEKSSKYYIKGGRLGMYPPKFNLYRCSRGIKKPIEEYMTENEAIKKVSGATLTFQSTLLFSDEKDGFNCVIDKKYYNTKKKSIQVAPE